MKQLTANQIRTAFLEYFKSHGHAALPSSPLVPHNDPTLMFTNSGMVQFKNFFTGAEKSVHKRATTSQKCVRAGGKHNDLDNVGYTARHHTFFEMLGNFSFGDYFKEDAIRFAWGFLTEVLELPKEKLLVTVYHDDDEAFGLWQKIAKLPKEKIIRIDTNDNFWSMGDTGPCGPCSEIFFDHGPGIAGGPPGSAEADGDRFIEIWNLVFMQYEQHEGGKRTNLPKPSIDTGMGLERVSAVLQGVHDNYDIDLFRNLIRATESLTRVAAEGEHAASYKVITDHLRSSCFLLADGVTPSNEGRGYVLRRIMRRAMRHVHLLGYDRPLMHQLVPALIQEMGEAYPELHRAKALMVETLRSEEERFRKTLGRGLALLDEEAGDLGKGDVLKGEIAFKLYDTFGFPVDLTADILRGKGAAVDMKGFEAAMQQQKERARAAWSGSGAKATDRLWFELHDRLGAVEFLGYTMDRAESTILALVKDGKEVREASQGETVAVVTRQTPFYGESGGQKGDRGVMDTADGALEVADTQKPLPSFIVHHGTVTKGMLRVGDEAVLHIDVENRAKLRANHSVTHLLHRVLREQLGEHITQQGSAVAHDRLRFDISHPKPITPEEIAAIEAEVNAAIWANAPVTTIVTSPEEAIKEGALALFGEKYGDEVRVVKMGDGAAEDVLSVELCGGTHVSRTGDIGLFKIISESALAAGVRRIEAVTREEAVRHYREQEARLKAIAEGLKTSVAEAPERVEALQTKTRELEKALSQARAKAALSGGADDAAETVQGIAFLGKLLEGLPAKELKPMMDQFKKKLGSGVVALVTVEGGKASLAVGVTGDLTDRISAVDLVRAGSEAIGGKGGGGRPDMAQAGAPDAARAPEALAAIKQALHMKIIEKAA